MMVVNYGFVTKNSYDFQKCHKPHPTHLLTTHLSNIHVSLLFFININYVSVIRQTIQVISIDVLGRRFIEEKRIPTQIQTDLHHVICLR